MPPGFSQKSGNIIVRSGDGTLCLGMFGRCILRAGASTNTVCGCHKGCAKCSDVFKLNMFVFESIDLQNARSKVSDCMETHDLTSLSGENLLKLGKEICMRKPLRDFWESDRDYWQQTAMESG